MHSRTRSSGRSAVDGEQPAIAAGERTASAAASLAPPEGDLVTVAAPLPLTDGARVKVLAYAKGDEDWATHLLDVAEEISRAQGWTEIRAEAVKAALLHCWQRERRIPRHPPQAPQNPPPSPLPATAAGDGDDGASDLPPPAAEAVRTLAARIAQGWRAVLARRRNTAAAADEPEEDAGAGGLLATLSGERFSYFALVAACVFVALIAWPLLMHDEDSLTPIALPPLAMPLSPEEAPPESAGEGAAPRPALLPLPAAEAARSAESATGRDPGATLRDVREAQTLLARLGYRPGATDGKVGPLTDSAIRAFQRDIGSSVSGAVSPRLLHQLRSRVVAVAPPAEIAKPAPERSSERKPTANPTLHTIGRWLGATYNSRRDLAAVERHCRAVPDNWIFDEAAGDVVHCSRFVPNSPPTPAFGRDHP